MIPILTYTHVTAGAISLLTGLVIFFLKKGDSRHKTLGKIYGLAMTVVFLTALPMGYFSNNIFLILIGIFSYYFVLSGIRNISVKSAANISWIDKSITLVFGASFLAMIAYGLYLLAIGKAGVPVLMLVFGGVGLLGIVADFKYHFLGIAPKEKHQWLYNHIGRMIGSYIAASTAFLVNVVHFQPALVLWLGPTVVGTAGIFYTVRKYKKIYSR